MPVAGDVLKGPRGRYRIVAEHGRGAFGTTFRATDESDERSLIVKVLHLRGLPSWKGLELFEREAAVLRALSHPRIPRWVDDLVLGPADAPTGFALVMEMIPGRTLQDLARAGGLSPQQMLGWLEQTLEILAAIHARSPPIIHRDVNPKNLILRPTGEIALVDFGSVQAALRESASTAAGTFGYAPLEQFVGRATPSSDLYGLGMTYLAVATGREPSELAMDGLRVDVRAALAADPKLVRLIESMVEPDPRFRLKSAEEALAALRTVTAESAPTSPPTLGIGSETYLSQLHRTLERAGFTIHPGGELGRTPLVFSAERSARALGRGAIQLFVARGEQVEGAQPGQPLEKVPGALYVAASLSVPRLQTSFWRSLVEAPALIAPVIVSAYGIGPRTTAHVASADRQTPGATVVPVLIDLVTTQIDLVMPRTPGRAALAEAIDELRRLLPSVGDPESARARSSS